MKTVVFNNDNLSDNDVNVVQNKVRAILVKDNSFLICNYAGVFLLPGGSVNKGESCDEAIIRELREEIGIQYKIQELERLLLLKHYQKDFPKREGGTKDRVLETLYYYGPYQGIDLSKTHRTEKEMHEVFELKQISFDELDDLYKIETGNPRKPYFDRELNEVVKALKMTMK